MNSHGQRSHMAKIWPRRVRDDAPCARAERPGADHRALVTASDQRKRGQLPPRVWVEPPIGIEPMTYSLRVRVRGRRRRRHDLWNRRG